jgi:hypothetical protein
MKRPLGLLLLAAGLLFCFLGLTVGVVLLARAEGKDLVLVLVPFVIGLAGVGMAVAGGLLLRGRKPLGHIPKPVNGRVGAYLADEPETREVDGQLVERLYQQPQQGSRREPMLSVRVPAVTPVVLRFDRETWFDRACKAVRVSREHQTGDAEFDAAVYIRGPGGEFTETYLSDPAKRLAVRELLAAGFTRVQLTGVHAVAVWSKFDPGEHHRAGLTTEAATRLQILAAGLPTTATGENPARSRFFTRGLLILLLVLFAWMLTGFSEFLYPPVRYKERLLPAAVVFVVGYPLFLFVAAFVLRGRSDSHDRWAKLAGAGLAMFAIGSAGMVLTINGVFDSSPPMERTLPVTGKQTTSEFGSTGYTVLVPAWDGSNESKRVDVSSAEYHQTVERKSQVRITTGRGALGIEWLKRKQIEP